VTADGRACALRLHATVLANHVRPRGNERVAKLVTRTSNPAEHVFLTVSIEKGFTGAGLSLTREPLARQWTSPSLDPRRAASKRAP
jgi:hypothetical protein